jgi:hypothetical protein
VETTLSTRKWDFRGTSISDFFNNIDVKRPLEIAAMDVAVGASGRRMRSVDGAKITTATADRRRLERSRHRHRAWGKWEASTAANVLRRVG